MISYLIGIGCSVLFSTIIAIFWMKGIDHMRENHPDYKGNDLFKHQSEDDPDVDYRG